MIPLENDFPMSLREGNSHIKLENFFLQSEAYSDRSPLAQLELLIREGDQEHRFFIWQWEKRKPGSGNYPMAFGSRFFSLIEEEGLWYLMVEDAVPGKEFFLELDQSVLIGELELTFLSSCSEFSVDPSGEYEGSLISAELQFTKDSISEHLNVESLESEKIYPVVLGAREYRLKVLQLSEKRMKLVLSE